MFRLPGLFLGGVALVALATIAPASASASDCCVTPAPCCEPAPVCCPPPPPVKVQLCVVDPCTGCTYSVSACVPACCANEVPCMAGWRNGIFGRKVLTYKWPGCGHCIEVVITKHGRTIVRD